MPTASPSAVPAARRFPADMLAAGELLSALAAPLRLSIVALLDEHGTRCVHELVDALGVPQPLVSQHLRVLRGARLVIGDRQHREVHYRLTDAHVGHIVRDAIAHAAHSAVADDDEQDTTPDTTQDTTPEPTEHPRSSRPRRANIA